MPLNQSQARPLTPRVQISSLSGRLSERVTIQARLQTSRPTSSKMIFFILRQRVDTVQALAVVNDSVSKKMVKFIANLPNESLVEIVADVSRPEPVEEIKSCTIGDVELKIIKVCLSLIL